MRGAGEARRATVLAVAVLLAVGGGVAGSTRASAERRPKPPPRHQRQQQQQGENLYGCDRTFGEQPAGHLVKRTNPAGGQPVHRGDSIVVTIDWHPSDWSSDQLHKVLDCVAIDGELQPSMQDGESPTNNDGRFTTVVRVPADVADGSQICDQAMLSGPSPRGDYDRQISNQVCHTVSGGGGASCGQSQECEGGCAEPSPCGGGSSCNGGCHQPPCDRCGGEQPCSSSGCRRSPPCDRGCAQRPPCDRGCAERPPCDQGCGQRPPCDADCGHGDCRGPDSCDSHRPGRDRDDRRDRGCDCDGRREGLVRRLVHKLV
jgi:hypothetical protein